MTRARPHACATTSRLAALAGIALLCCLPLAARADIVKCTMPDGATRFQDTPCAGARSAAIIIKKEVLTPPPPRLTGGAGKLASTLARMLLERHLWASTHTPVSDFSTKAYRECLAKADSSAYLAAVETQLKAELSAEQLRLVSKFYDTPAGYKLVNLAMASFYDTIEVRLPSMPPLISAAEAWEIAVFKSQADASMLVGPELGIRHIRGAESDKVARALDDACRTSTGWYRWYRRGAKGRP